LPSHLNTKDSLIVKQEFQTILKIAHPMQQRQFHIQFHTPAFLGDATQSGRWRTPPRLFGLTLGPDFFAFAAQSATNTEGI
jgi:hypothetical protein